MSSFIAMRILLCAGEMFVASTLVLVLAHALARNKSASKRHLVWFVAFGVLMALPIFAAIAPGYVHLTVPAPAIPLAHDFDMVSGAAPPAEPAAFSFDNATIAVLLVVLWLAGVCLVALRGMAAAIGLHVLRRRSIVHDFPDLPEIASHCELRVSVADEDCGPVTWGIFRPIILLPGNAVLWTRERLEAVLLHEAAHIRRHDSLAQISSLLVCAFYWPNPLVWIAARRMRREAEIAADDAVIVSGVKPSTYAGELLELAAEFRVNRLALAAPLFMAAPSGLEARVQSVLAPTQQRSGVNSMDVLKITCAGLLATTALIAARPSLAQDAPAAPPLVVQQALPPAAPATAAIHPGSVTPISDVAPPESATPATPAATADGPTEPTEPTAPTADNAPTPSDGDDVQVRETIRKIDGREIRRIQMTVRKARQEAREAIARARPEIARAMVEARAGREAALQAVRDAQPQIDAALQKIQPEIDKAMAQVRVELAKANLDVKIRARVDEALKRAEVRIQAREGQLKKSGRDVQDDNSDTPDDQ